MILVKRSLEKFVVEELRLGFPTTNKIPDEGGTTNRQNRQYS